MTQVDSAPYVAAHGKQPRGQGAWAFCPADAYRRDDYLDFVMWHHGSFAQAKKYAVAYFRAKGVARVVVCS